MLPGDQFVHHDGEREQIRSAVERLATKLFGRHVADRPGWSNLRRDPIGRPHVSHGDSEVEHDDAPVRRAHHVLRLEVAVDDARGVRRRERLEHLEHHRNRIPRGERSARELSLYRLSLDKAGDDERLALLLDERAHGRDVRMIGQPRGRPGLLAQRAPGVLVTDDRRVHGLDGDDGLEHRVASSVNDSHPARPHDALDDVGTEPSAGREGRSWSGADGARHSCGAAGPLGGRQELTDRGLEISVATALLCDDPRAVLGGGIERGRERSRQA